MARRHGRAVMPFGKFKGVRIRLIPDAYLSWMTTALKDQKWWWIRESLIAELKFRGLRADLADTPEPTPIPVLGARIRKFRLGQETTCCN